MEGRDLAIREGARVGKRLPRRMQIGRSVSRIIGAQPRRTMSCRAEECGYFTASGLLLNGSRLLLPLESGTRA